MKKTLFAIALAGAVFSPVAASAQDVPESVQSALIVGAQVFGPNGAEVGTIDSMPGGNVVVFTGKHKATLPAAAFGKNENGLIISMTREQLDGAIEAAEAEKQAAMDAALVADAQILSSDGVVIGTVQKVEGENVIVDLPAGSAITLQKQHLMADQGSLKLFMTAAEFNSAVSAATGG